MSEEAARAQRPVRILKVRTGESREATDHLAAEEPLEIRLVHAGQLQTVAITMRTPGDDEELAAGFLYAEGVVRERAEISSILPRPAFEGAPSNVVDVELAPGVPQPELASLERHFFSTSACGVCGKATLEALAVKASRPVASGPPLAPETILSFPARLSSAQGIFAATGGLHAAALFNWNGELLSVREDVGRHNALDKLLGRALLDGKLPLSDHLVLVSGRSSYEILQKSVMAGVPVVCAVSAPSSLAVEMAERFGVTLVGFLRGDRFNVYAGRGRIKGDGENGE